MDRCYYKKKNLRNTEILIKLKRQTESRQTHWRPWNKKELCIYILKLIQLFKKSTEIQR